MSLQFVADELALWSGCGQWRVAVFGLDNGRTHGSGAAGGGSEDLMSLPESVGARCPC